MMVKCPWHCPNNSFSIANLYNYQPIYFHFHHVYSPPHHHHDTMYQHFTVKFSILVISQSQTLFLLYAISPEVISQSHTLFCYLQYHLKWLANHRPCLAIHTINCSSTAITCFALLLLIPSSELANDTSLFSIRNIYYIGTILVVIRQWNEMSTKDF